MFDATDHLKQSYSHLNSIFEFTLRCIILYFKKRVASRGSVMWGQGVHDTHIGFGAQIYIQGCFGGHFFP